MDKEHTKNTRNHKGIKDIYGIEVSESTISRITDKVLEEAKDWQQRPLESIYAVLFLDAIHYHVRSEGRVVKKAVYIAIGIGLDGKKDVLGMWVPYLVIREEFHMDRANADLTLGLTQISR